MQLLRGGGTSPALTAAALNGLSVVRFDGATTYLDAGANTSLDMTQWSFFVVGKVNTNKDYNYWFGKGNDASENYEFLSYAVPYMHTPILFTSGTRTFTNTASPTAVVNLYTMWEYDYSAAGGRAISYSGTSTITDAENRTPQTNALSMWIGNERATAGRILNGDIAELVLFKTRLSLIQRIVVGNYLSAKYGLAMTSNDFYTMDNVGNGNYDYNVAGVGQASDGTSQTDSRGTGIVEINNVSGLANGRYLFWGDDNGLLPANNSVDVPPVSPNPVMARMNRTWRVSKTGAITSEDITFDLAGLGAVTPSDLRLLIDKNGSGTFADETVAGGGVLSGFTFVSGTTYKLAGVNLLDGERFTLGTINTPQTPLPIELVTFNATPCNNNVCLDWSTATETNNDFFTIEKSQDGINFITVVQMNGSGNSITSHSYTAVDDNPYSGVSYYRLKQTDYNGHITYSQIRMVDFVLSSDFVFNV